MQIEANIEVKLSSWEENLNIHFIKQKKTLLLGAWFFSASLFVLVMFSCPPGKKHFQLVFWRLIIRSLNPPGVSGWLGDCTGVSHLEKVNSSSVVYRYISLHSLNEKNISMLFLSSLVLLLFPPQYAALRSITRLMLV